MDFDEILSMQYCDEHMKFSTELWPLIDVKISNFRNNEWSSIKFCLCIGIYDPCCD